MNLSVTDQQHYITPKRHCHSEAIEILTVSREHLKKQSQLPPRGKLPLSRRWGTTIAMMIRRAASFGSLHPPYVTCASFTGAATCCLKHVPLWAFMVTLWGMLPLMMKILECKKHRAGTISLNTVFKLILQFVVCWTQKNTIKNN